ncbi:heptosyltransferase-1 [Kaistia soli DSM 19436]|uniref:Lipopolysaccharide heptosyltransferase 1 n=1 Tax=Kaistia soli DSM 19436 TaxID=1122133 RepID=A0A1M5K9N5_9HYPH|nr:lipopolysaccharide heptosyltransferase I [Kaistia soli]SHG49562.1 heptosyltransferase-1 [Kaistia soli DSM 19436]
MRVLLVKLSSLGDVVHSFPALTDAASAMPGLEIDWVVDEAFAPLARLHPAVNRVIQLPIRRMKKTPRAAFGDLRLAMHQLRATRYDLIIDAQGLWKSAIVGRLARGGRRHGFSRDTAREGTAALTYDVGHALPEVEHMATRIRRLFAAVLGYPMPQTPVDPGLDRGGVAARSASRPYIVLIHGTTWPTKTWTVEGWRSLAIQAGEAGLDVLLFAHGDKERARVDAIADGIPAARRLPPGRLEAVIPVIAGAEGVVTVDTGLGHLAAAFDLPTVGLYGPTNPGLTGLVGARAHEFIGRLPCVPCEKSSCAIRPDFGEGPPCLADHAPEAVWRALQKLNPNLVGRL